MQDSKANFQENLMQISPIHSRMAPKLQYSVPSEKVSLHEMNAEIISKTNGVGQDQGQKQQVHIYSRPKAPNSQSRDKVNLSIFR